MKKYALITIHDTQNFGSCLQTYSTIKAFEKLGCDIELLDYKNEAIWGRECAHLENVMESPKKLLKYLMWGKEQKRKLNSIRKFMSENVHMSEHYDKNNIKLANEKYDVFITGSDIVWGLVITGNDLSYFLDFTDDDKTRVAFAASIGTKWNDEQAKLVKPLINRYDYLGVREQQSVAWLSEVTDKKVVPTCDPTCLWETEFWSKYLLEDYSPKEDYVLIYLLHNDGKNLRDGIKYAKEHNMSAYFINYYGDVKGAKTVKPKTVSEWITLIANAKIVFTASFHGTLYSMYFNTPVFFYNRGAKSRLYSLAEDIGITNREGLDENIQKNEPIDFEHVHQVLLRKREESWTYLKNTISSIEK